MKKKVLILAYDFPPYISVGSLRPYNWMKYLPQFGVEPVVVTRQWSNRFGNKLDYIAPGESADDIIEQNEYGIVVRTAYKPNLSNRLLLKYGENRFTLLRKCISGFLNLMDFLFHAGPKSRLYRGAKQYLRENKVDAIIATGEPFILFSYASKLSATFDIPWIADYRDSWSQNTNRSSNLFLKYWNQYFEKKCLKNARSITTVSEFMKSRIESSIQGKPFHILTNGYDPELIDSVKHIRQGSDFLQIAFAGTIYKWHPVENFLEAFSEFLSKKTNAKIRLNFYGINNELYMEKLLKNVFPEIRDHVNIYPKMPNDKLLKLLPVNNVMLLFNDYSYLGTKIYDYLGIERKILLCYSDSEESKVLKDKYYSAEELAWGDKSLQEDLILKTNSGVIVKDKTHLLLIFEELYEDYLTTGRIVCNSEGTENYSRKIQVGKLARLL